MAKRQTHEQSRISKYMQAILDTMMITTDPVERKKLEDELEKMQNEWMEAGRKGKSLHHYMNGNLTKEEDTPKKSTD